MYEAQHGFIGPYNQVIDHVAYRDPAHSWGAARGIGGDIRYRRDPLLCHQPFWILPLVCDIRDFDQEEIAAGS